MTRTDWLLSFIAVSIFANVACPRYEWRAAGEGGAYIRLDRWSGAAQVGHFLHVDGRAVGAWVSEHELWRELNAGVPVRPSSESLRRARVGGGRLLDRIEEILKEEPDPGR